MLQRGVDLFRQPMLRPSGYAGHCFAQADGAPHGCATRSPIGAKRGARDRTRTGTGFNSRRIFLPATAFAATLRKGVWGLDYPFTMTFSVLGAARLVSTPS